MSTPQTERPMRADALRNRDRILAAARVAFAEHGPDVAVSEILRIAGVGSGTLFRHFPTKRDLLIAVLESAFDQMGEALDEAMAMDDPWSGLVHVLSVTAEMQARDKMVLESVGPELFTEERFARRNAEMMVQLEQLIAKGQSAGVVREDLVAEDVPFLVAAMGGATQACTPNVAGLSPTLWKRYLGIVLDGLRPAGASALGELPPTREQLAAAKAAKH